MSELILEKYESLIDTERDDNDDDDDDGETSVALLLLKQQLNKRVIYFSFISLYCIF